MRNGASRLSIFIDGGHYNALQRYHLTNFNFLYFVQEIQKHLPQPADLLHIFYYDCLPYTSTDSSPEELEALYKRRSYFNFLRSQPAVRVREGTVVKRTLEDGRVVFQQKRVDLLLGLDIAEECSKKLMTHLALIAGDADFVPAVEFASHKGVQVWLIHGPRELHSDALWSAADGRIEVDEVFARKVSKRYNNIDNAQKPVNS